MIKIEIITKENLEITVNKLRFTGWVSQEVEQYVRNIIQDVIKRGDEALIDYTEKFDGVKLNKDEIIVKRDEINEAYSKVSDKEISALKIIKDNIMRVERKNLEGLKWRICDEDIEIFSNIKPIESVGCYIPGGRASYPSSVLMTTIPPIVAGVPRIAICNPPSKLKALNPLVLIAADICGVKEIYRVGGVQAIAALAYGTESIKPVKKIVGPGNIYVTLAKKIVSNDVAIDMLAGPTELLIIADQTTNLNNVVRDLISQAEHGDESICGVVTISKNIANQIINLLEKTIQFIERRDIVINALSTKGFIAICENVEQVIEFVNLFAPEHLEIMVKNFDEYLDKINSAGLILLGEYSPVAISDYCVGTNHVLPTGGYASIRSGLSVLDFIKQINVVKCSKKGLKKFAEPLQIIASAEGLYNHWLAIKERLG
ncbi:MAG: histidinol dehydrogenase [Nitrososphaerales archaeon]